MDEWDVQLQQGLFILARLDQDVREGVIPFTPMMILTHHSRLDLAARIGEMQLGGYASKQALLSDPYTTLRHHVPGIRPTDVDIDRKLGQLTADVKMEARLVRQIRDSIRGGLDPDVACSALRRLADPNDWRVVGLTLEELDAARSAFSSEELARALAQAWYASPDGWLRVQELAPLGAVDERFYAVRMEMGPPRGSAFSAVAAATAVPASEAPGSGVLRERFRLLRAIDGCSHPVRIRAGRWTVLGCWLPEPPLAGGGRPHRGQQSAARRVRDLHRLGLAHGSLTPLTTAFESPVFGGIRCLLGDEDVGDLRADDLARLAALAIDEHAGCMVARSEPDPAGGGVGVFRDRLVASLGPGDVVLSEVECGDVSPVPVDLVVCTAGAIAVLEHRGERRLDRCEGALERWRRCADALASVAEGRLGLTPGTVSRLTALVVADGAEADGPTAGWSSVATESAVIAALVSTSGGGHPPPGTRIAGALPPQPRGGSSRALHWRTIHLGEGTRLRTRRRQWLPKRWRELASGLAAARDGLAELPAERRPFGLTELRAYDGTGERCAVDDPSVELLEYDASVPGAAVPLTARVAGARGHAVRRRLAADVLRQLSRWERSGLAYRTMEPDGLVCVDGAVHCDLLQSIVRADPRELRRQRRGAAASLVLLLSPWPYLWPAVVERTLPMLDHGPDEGSAWGIAAVALRALLDGDRSPTSLAALLEERIALLDAAARLDSRFPAWPPGLAEVAYP
jgi:hypothetical protein